MTPHRDPRGRADDRRPTFSPRLYRWFCRYLRFYFRRHFTGVRVRGPEWVASWNDRPVVVYANHPSWWDPIFLFLLHAEHFPGRAAYGPMDAKALGKYGLLKRLGVFGVDLDSPRGAVTFLRTCRSILAGPDAVLYLTAQGRFADPRERPVRLQPGLAHLVRSHPDLVVFPLALEYPFWNERQPEALALFGDPIEVARAPGLDVAVWTDRLERSLAATQDRLAAAARRRDPAGFRTLLAGRTGVGGIYDAWRRLAARLRGRRFRPAHGDVDA